MFGEPDAFAEDPGVWGAQAAEFRSASGAAADVAAATLKATDEAVWKGPMPDDRSQRMESQTADAVLCAEIYASMATACDRIVTAAADAKSDIDDLRSEWDDAQFPFFDRFGKAGEADDRQSDYRSATAGHRRELLDLAAELDPIIARGDPLELYFEQISVPGSPDLGEQVDTDLAGEYFESGELVDVGDVADITDTITELSEEGNPPADWDEWAEVNGYSAQEVQAALDALDADQRAQLDQWLADNKGSVGSGSTALSSFLLLNMRADQVEEFHNEVPNLEPTLHDNSDGWIDGDVDMTVDFDGTPGGPGFDDVDQGAIGDCVTLATLSASVAADPDFFADHIWENPNGTYTVTVYDENGDPVRVTVSGFIPGNGDDPAYNGDDTGEITWASIYEKATAAYQGGTYESIDGSVTSNRLPSVTGSPMERVELPASDGDDLYTAMEDAFQNNRPIGIGGPIPPRDPGDATNHSYAVVGVENGLITVMNPWGGDGAVEVFTIEEFQNANFGYVAITE